MSTIQSLGVVGAGIMGGGIAQVFATAGLEVTLIDLHQTALEKGLQSIANSLDRLVKKEKITPQDKFNTLALEAATENKELKEKIIQLISDVVSPNTIIASNTSSLSVTELAALDQYPGRVIGMHFFNPPPLMALVEIIRGLQTSDATHETIYQLAKQIGKEPITVKNSPGFVVNRILVPMINEAFFVLAEGLASPEDIDAGMKLGCNQPIGPLALADLIGLDTCLAVLEVYFNNFNDSKYRPCPLLREMVAAGYLGRKSGRGVFQY
ncbi:MAG: 3-hydroxyacyl-CoA dehydrogenase NAD-binding domain-containing protein [Burkholderiales bacterium]|nr:3-hydroxyacyl-CoA dehydrogenase NAD-binding domain-containing protein [Burkholderiales bacterium]